MVKFRQLLCKLNWHSWLMWETKTGPGLMWGTLVDTVELRRTCVHCTKEESQLASMMPSEDSELQEYLEHVVYPASKNLSR